MTPNNPTPPPPAHTAGRLTINEHGRVLTQSGGPFRANGVAQTASNFDSSNLVEAEANSRRVVALWNACQAIPTAALEAGAVERMVDEAYLVAGAWMDDSLSKDDVQNLLAALAQVAGQAGGREAQP